jgi:hypothetical protein
VRHLPDTNFWHYALQLNTYKTIIEDKYGAKVVGLCLVCLHPDNANGTYQIINVPFLEKEIADLFEYRRSMLRPKALEPGATDKPRQGATDKSKTTDSIPTGPKGATNVSKVVEETLSKVSSTKPPLGATDKPGATDKKPPSGGPKQGYKPKGLMIDLTGL